MNLRVRVVHCNCAGNHWFADIDDADDPQPDDPFWYRDGCDSQSEALRSACAQLSALTDRIENGASLIRVFDADLVNA